MLTALAEIGVAPDMIVGSSVGALNAAFFAGEPTVAGAAKLAAIWRGLRRQDVFPFTLRTAVMAAVPAEMLTRSSAMTPPYPATSSSTASAGAFTAARRPVEYQVFTPSNHHSVSILGVDVLPAQAT